MTTRTDFRSIMELKEKYSPKVRGFVNSEESKIIRETLEVESRNEIELQNIRDMVVILYGQWGDAMREVERLNNDAEAGRKFDEYRDAMSAITCVIDHEKISRGMEV